DSTTFLPKTDVVFNSAGLDMEYRREGSASTDITEVTQTVSGAYTDGGFVHIANGYYRVDLPDAACAAGAIGVLVHGTVTGGVVLGCYVHLTFESAANLVGEILNTDRTNFTDANTVGEALNALPAAAPG